MRERSIGLGAMGFHAYIQRNNIPFESIMAAVRTMKCLSISKQDALQELRRTSR